MPGYQCTYSKQISLVVTLTNVTQSAFQNDVNSVRTNLIKAIAAAANVTVAQVNITSFSPRVSQQGGRRLLTVHTHMGLHHHTIHHKHKTSSSQSHGMQILTPSKRNKGFGFQNIQMLDVFSDVHGSKRILNLNHHLARHNVPLHTWREV